MLLQSLRCCLPWQSRWDVELYAFLAELTDELKVLFHCQGDIKRDPDGYADDFRLQVYVLLNARLLLRTVQACQLTTAHFNVLIVGPCCSQYRHYRASLEIFNLKPSKESREFAELVHFIAQVCQSPDNPCKKKTHVHCPSQMCNDCS